MSPDQRDKMIGEYAQGASTRGLAIKYEVLHEQILATILEAGEGKFLSPRHLLRVQQLQTATNQSPEALAKVWGCQPSKVDAVLRMLQTHGAIKWTKTRHFAVTEIAVDKLKQWQDGAIHE